MGKAILFDTETTGKNEPQIVEAAWLHLEAPGVLRIIEEFDQRYKPSKPIEMGALATHHILDEELQGCPPHDSFCLPEGTTYLIGHNVDYDWAVAGSPETVKRICTCAISRLLWPECDSHSQSALMYFLYRDVARETLQNAHSAVSDTMNCRAILIAIINKLNESGQIETWEDLWLISEHARIPTVMAFGKHKGTLIKDLPRDYVQWMMKQSDMDLYVIQAVRQAFNL